ncbi:hypothetical protein FGO68_gene6109 [Halteria grandinella]|uniref:Uncharacterized protein n=1 Tax=Halteria grandinella TaxID=5974 RepID=A0A8J8NFA7_HALGN|nr:hypothetical protein FGO68_gene6109 [Halteria grandinella]
MKIIEKHDQVLLRGILQHLPPETKLQIQTEVFNNGKREKCEFWSECYETSIRRSAKFLVANPLTDLKDLEMLKRVLEQQFPQYLESEIILNLLDNLTPRFRIGDQLFFSRIKILYIEDVRCFQEEHIQFIPEQNKIYCLIPWVKNFIIQEW